MMGVSSSHPSCGGGLGLGGAHHHPKHSRANLGATVSAEDLLSANFRGEKKKKRSGLSTLKRKLVGKKKVSVKLTVTHQASGNILFVVRTGELPTTPGTSRNISQTNLWVFSPLCWSTMRFYWP